MRVSEYAKEYNLAPRDVMDTLRQNGHQVADLSSDLSADMIALLNRTIGGESARPRGPRFGSTDGGARGPRPPRPAGAGPYVPRGPRPAGAQSATPGETRSEGGQQATDDRRGAWRRPGAPVAGRSEAAPAAAPLVDKKPSGKKSTAPKKRSGKKEKEDTDAETTATQNQSRANRETVITPPLVECAAASGDTLLVDFASMVKKSVSEVIFVLLKNGIAKNVHAMLTINDMKLLCETFGILFVVEDAPAQKHAAAVAADKKTGSSDEYSEQRLPVVVVMGHVDHGKTTLLDYLRKTNVVAKEKGGITQHLSAYEVQTGKRKAIFLDTPGHEAFSAMRTRGTRITDIAIIIVAVNDGIKPQTVEAINLAKQAGVPIVVAINKIDKLDSEAQLETLRAQLAQHGLTPEEWGGDTVCVKISAKTGEGVDDLLDMLGLMADMLDLKTSTTLPARAFVLETRQLKGHGLAVTVICREGTLRKGDYFICGQTTGKVRLLIDSYGAFLSEVGPSIPVQIIGFDEAHGLGDHLEVVSAAEYQEARAAAHNRKPATISSSAATAATKDGEAAPTLRLMFKADMQGSCQAIIDAVAKMEQNEKNKSIRLELLSCEVGPISENDVIRAADTGAVLFGLHVRADKNAQAMAKEKRVEIVLHDIIYHLFEQLEEMIKTERRKIVRLVEAGKAEVLKVFPIKGHKVIAGCMIKEGVLRIGDKVVCIRSRQEVGGGKVVTLQRDRKDAKEIFAGNDCGLLTDTFHDWSVGDRVTIFTHQQEED